MRKKPVIKKGFSGVSDSDFTIKRGYSRPAVSWKLLWKTIITGVLLLFDNLILFKLPNLFTNLN